MLNFRNFAVLCLVGMNLVYLPGCATTSQARKTEASGFLRDYSMLKPGAEGEAQLLYVNPSVKFQQYSKILIDPIAIYSTDENSALYKLSADELKAIVDYLDATVREQLSSDYTFVNKPEPGAMRLRIAITEAKGANVLMSAASSVTPTGIALNGLKKGITGAATGVSSASCEMELVDSMSNTRLVAAVDSRVGSKATSFNEWQGVKEAYDYWAGRLRTRLAEFRKS